MLFSPLLTKTFLPLCLVELKESCNDLLALIRGTGSGMRMEGESLQWHVSRFKTNSSTWACQSVYFPRSLHFKTICNKQPDTNSVLSGPPLISQREISLKSCCHTLLVTLLIWDASFKPCTVIHSPPWGTVFDTLCYEAFKICTETRSFQNHLKFLLQTSCS